MANKTISKVSLDELNEARDQNFSIQNQSSNNQIQTNTDPTTSYILKLKDDDIIKFFEPFGFIAMQRQNEQINGIIPMVEIYCDDFVTAFSDYDIVVGFNVSSQNTKNKTFDAVAFIEYCNAIETTPEKAMADIIQTKLLGQRFHSYQKSYDKRKQKERKEAFDALPKSLQKHVSLLDEKREHELEGMKNKLMYDSFSGDPRTKN